MALFWYVFLFRNYRDALDFVDIFVYFIVRKYAIRKMFFLDILSVSCDKANLFHLSIQQHLGEEFHENY